MAKTLKITVWTLGIILVLLVALVVAAPFIIDPNDYRDEISTVVERQTGRELTIEGDIGLSVFPWLGLELGAVRLGNAKGFGPEPFARIEEADVRVKLLPLLRREVEMDTVTLHGLRLNLARQADGTTNWADLAEGKPAEAAPEEEPAADGRAAAALALGGLRVRDARLVWDDRMLEKRYVVENLTLTSGAIQLAEPFPVDLAFDFQSDAPKASGHIEFGGEITADLEAQRYRLEGLGASARVEGPVVPGGKVAAELKADALAADLAADTANVQGLVLTSAGARVEGKADVKGLSAGPNGGGRLRLVLDDPAALFEALGAAPEGLKPAALEGAAVEAPLAFDLKAQTATIEPLTVTAAGLELSGRAAASDLQKTPRVEGQLESNEFSPRKLMQRLGLELPEMKDDEALGRARLALGFEASPAHVDVEPLKLELDETTLTGSAAAREFAKPVVRFDLKADRLNADRYLPPKQEGTAATPAQAAAAGAGQLPLEPLRRLDVRGSVGLDSLQLLNMKVSQLRAEVDGRNGQFRVHPITMKLYDGGYSGDMRFDVRGKRPKFDVNEKLEGVQVGPLLADLVGKDHVTGTAFVTADLKGAGIEPEVVRRTLSGKAAFRFQNGAVKGINIAQMLRKAQAALGGGSAPEDAAKKTDFTELKGSVRIDKGVVRNDDLSAKSPLLRVDGAGQANIVKETVDYRVETSVVGTLKGQGGKGLDELKGLTIPIRVHGPFTKPDFDVELDSVLKAKAKQAVEEKKDKLKEEAERKLEEKVKEETEGKAEDAVKEKLKDKLDGLFR